RPGAAAPKGVITPGAVKLLNFAGKSGYFSYPETGSKCVAAAHRRLEPGEKFVSDVSPAGEECLSISTRGMSVRSHWMSSRASWQVESSLTKDTSTLIARQSEWSRHCGPWVWVWPWSTSAAR